MNWTTNRQYKFPVRNFAELAKAYAKTHDLKYLYRHPCIHDPKFLEIVEKEICEEIKTCKQYSGVRDVCMGDEMSLTHYTKDFDFCFCPYTIKAFRAWLPAVYPSIKTLNKSWDTDFKSWSEVMPLTLIQARKRGKNFAPWADHRTFMEISLAGFFLHIRKSLRKEIPNLRCGLSGTQAPAACNGMDWWRLSKAFDFYHSYNTGNSRDLRRSFMPDTGVAMSPYALGYNKSGKEVESSAWECLFTQTEGISAWTTRLFFNGDLTFSPSGRDTRNTLQELKAGIWRLIRHSKIQCDGIALHYSHPSIHAATALGRNIAFAKARAAWVNLLLDTGLSFDFIAYAQIEQGKLASGKYKVLILPESIALSAKEIHEIHKFVERGGILIADNSAGIMNDHCTPVSSLTVKSLFGIQHKRMTKSVIPEGITMIKDIGLMKTGQTLKISGYNSAITSIDATAYGKSKTGFPVILEKQTGRGFSYFLNMQIQQYNDDRIFGGENTKRMQDLLLSLIAKAKVIPFAELRNNKNERARFRTVRYINGNNIYLGFVSKTMFGDEPLTITVKLKEKFRVMNIRTGKHMGVTREFHTVITPGEARLYSLTPAVSLIPAFAITYSGCTIPAENTKLCGIPPKGTGACAPLGGVLKWKLSTPAPVKGVRVFHVEYIGPLNQIYHPYDDVLVLPSNRMVLFFSRRFALNDPKGDWKLRVRDIATGKTIEMPFLIAGIPLK